MKKSIFLFLLFSEIFILGFLISSCKKENSLNKDVNSVENPIYNDNGNIQPFSDNIMPEATVKLKTFNHKKSRYTNSSLTPAYYNAIMVPGESRSEDVTATITLPIERGDVMFMFDLTKSMEQELANVKVNSQNIMGEVGTVINDVNYGVVSHMDYIESFNSCGYDDRYGGSAYGDYPYQLDQSITSNENSIVDAVNNLHVGWGWDYPECYSRVLYELSASDAGIGWRQGAKKIVVAWLDNQPHDCSLGTGPDPGRDEIADTDDDLEIYNVLNNLVEDNISLFVLYSGGDPLGGEHLSLWKEYCEITGGEAYRINQDGSIPDSVQIDDYISDIIEAEVSHLDQLTLEICTPGFENWLTNINPSQYTDINNSGSFPFTVEFTVPEGTVGGVYQFDICLVGDGVEFGQQHVTIEVFDGLLVPFDIKPDGCPNPFNVHYNGELPVAILGFNGFNVNTIDWTTLNIEGIHPFKRSYSDVATPYYPFIGKDLDEMSCNNNVGPDGKQDLNLKFNNLSIASFLSGYDDGDIVRIYIRGNLLNGTKILGEDIVRIINNQGTQTFHN